MEALETWAPQGGVSYDPAETRAPPPRPLGGENHWAQRIIGLLLPFAKDIPHLRAVNGENVHQEYLDLLGDTRFRTLRIHMPLLREHSEARLQCHSLEGR